MAILSWSIIVLCLCGVLFSVTGDRHAMLAGLFAGLAAVQMIVILRRCERKKSRERLAEINRLWRENR
jgi:hypothetical protein